MMHMKMATRMKAIMCFDTVKAADIFGEQADGTLTEFAISLNEFDDDWSYDFAFFRNEQDLQDSIGKWEECELDENSLFIHQYVTCPAGPIFDERSIATTNAERRVRIMCNDPRFGGKWDGWIVFKPPPKRFLGMSHIWFGALFISQCQNRLMNAFYRKSA